MKYITPEEAERIAGFAPGIAAMCHARDAYDYCYGARRAEHYGPSWSHYCASAACYFAGRVDGIRAERERRRKAAEKRKQAETEGAPCV